MYFLCNCAVLFMLLCFVIVIIVNVFLLICAVLCCIVFIIVNVFYVICAVLCCIVFYYCNYCKCIFM